MSSLSREPRSSSGELFTSINSTIFNRQRLWYGVPVIDPAAVTHASQLSRDPAVIFSNLFLALVFTMVLGIAGAVLQRLSATDGTRLRRYLQRLPFQLIATLLLIGLARFLVPEALAQAGEPQGASLLRLPLFALLFFLLVGASNALFHVLLERGRDAFDRTFRDIFGATVLRALWFIAFLILLYGIVGAYINPEFSLLPALNPGIVIIVVLTIILSGYAADFLRFLIARRWSIPTWFQANVPGLAAAVLCVAVSREFALNPGFIYGLPVGLLLVLPGKRQEGSLQSMSLSLMLILALVCWLLIPLLIDYEVPSDIVTLLFVILAEGAFFEALPLPGLAGESIYRWRRTLWAALTAVTVFLLFSTLLHPQGAIADIARSPPAFAAVLLLGCFATGVFLLWGYLTWTRRRHVPPLTVRAGM